VLAQFTGPQGRIMADRLGFTSVSDAVFDALPVGGFVHSPEHILAANHAACDLLASPDPADLEGRAIADHIHPDGREAGLARRALLFERDQRFLSVPVKMLTALGAPFTLCVSATSFTHEGERFAVAAACAADRVCSPGTPVTSRPASSLREAALEAFPLPVLGVSERRVTVANAAARTLLGRDETADPIGEDALSLLHPDSRDAMEERTDLLLRLDGRAIRIPLKAMTADGRDLHLSSLAAGITHEGRGVFTFVVTDVAR